MKAVSLEHTEQRPLARLGAEERVLRESAVHVPLDDVVNLLLA